MTNAIDDLETSMKNVVAFLREKVAAVEAKLQPVETEVKTFVVDKVEPEVASALNVAGQLIARNGGSLLLAIAGDALTAIVSGNWAAVVVNIVAQAKAAGIEFVKEEEALAASTALQVQQTLANAAGNVGLANAGLTGTGQAQSLPAAAPQTVANANPVESNFDPAHADTAG